MEPFEFDNFLGIFPPKNGMATKKQLKELLEFIGGFEKWPFLNEDCRREVVKYLDYKSRFNLGICSKEDQETVEKVKIYVQSVEIQDSLKLDDRIRKKEFDKVTVVIRFPRGKSIVRSFSQLEQDTRIEWLHFIPEQRSVIKKIIWKSCDYYEEAVKFTEKWMKKSNFEMEEIKVDMEKYPFESSQIKSLPCCKKVTICADDVDSFKWWLEKCPEKLDYLKLDVHSEDRESFTFPSDFLNAPQVMRASGISFGLMCKAALSDEQLLKFNGKTLGIVSVTVTDKGINEFIKYWVHGKGVDGFKSLHLWNTNARDLDVMLAGLEYVGQPCCKIVRISADDVESFHWWLRKVPEQLDLLQLCAYSGDRESLTLSSIFFNAPQILQASKFNLWRRSVVSDEQLLKLNGKSMSFDCVVVTDIGINQFIKRWVNGKGVNGFEKFQLWATGDRDSEVMAAGLEYVGWDETFENEQWEFVDRFDRSYDYFGWCYQIKSKVDRFESLTLGIDDDRVAILATGKRAEKNGEAYTCYRIP